MRVHLGEHERSDERNDQDLRRGWQNNLAQPDEDGELHTVGHSRARVEQTRPERWPGLAGIAGEPDLFYLAEPDREDLRRAEHHPDLVLPQVVELRRSRERRDDAEEHEDERPHRVADAEEQEIQNEPDVPQRLRAEQRQLDIGRHVDVEVGQVVGNGDHDHGQRCGHGCDEQAEHDPSGAAFTSRLVELLERLVLPLEEPVRFLPREDLAHLPPGPVQILGRLVPLLRLLVVECHHFVEILEPFLVKLLDGPGNEAVQLLPLVGQERVVRHLLDQVVLEEVLEFLRLIFFKNELQRPKLPQPGVHLRLVRGNMLQHRPGEFPPDDRRIQQHLPDAMLQPVDAGHDDPLHRLRNAPFEILVDDVHAPLGDGDHSPIEQRTDRFFDEEWISFRPFSQDALDHLGDPVDAEMRLHQVGCLGLGEPVQVDERAREFGRLWCILRAEDEEEQSRTDRRFAKDMVHQGLREAIDPVQVFQDEHARLPVAKGRQQVLRRPEDLSFPGLVDLQQDLLIPKGKERCQVGFFRLQRKDLQEFVQTRAGLLFSGLRTEAKNALEQRRPQIVGRVDLEAGAFAHVGGHSLAIGETQQLLGQTALPHTRFSRETETHVLSREDRVEGLFQLRLFLLPADEGTFADAGAGGGFLPETLEMVHVDRLRPAPDADGPGCTGLGEAVDDPERVAAQTDLTGRSVVEHSGRHGDGFAHHRISRRRIAAGDDGSGVDGDGHAEGRPLGNRLQGVEPLDVRSHFERAAHRPFGVVFVGHGGAERGHEAVFGRKFFRRAVEFFDDGSEPFEAVAHGGRGGIRIARLVELVDVRQGREQDGNETAFPLGWPLCGLPPAGARRSVSGPDMRTVGEVLLDRLQRLDQFLRAAESLSGVFLERFLDDALEPDGNLRREFGRRRWRLVQDEVDDRLVVLSFEWQAADRGLVHRDAERPEIGRGADRLAPDLFGRHVRDRADEGRLRGEA